MLEALRKHSRSWGSKLIFGAIALIFALYFGFSFNQGPPGGPAAPVAKVDGETIPFGLFTQTVQNQTALLERFNPGKIPEETFRVVENQVLQSLIGKTLLAQEAHHLGLRVPDLQLAEEIRGNPAFQKDGRFSESFYLNQFKPYFERENGEDYEDALRQDLLLEKLRDALEKAAVVSTRQAETQKKLQQTQLNVKQWSLAIQKGDAASRDQALKLAREWIADDKIPEGSADSPKPAVTETGLKPVSELIQQLGREDSLPPLQCLLEIQAGKKCDSPFQIGDQIVAVQLLEKKTLESNPLEPDSIASQVAQGRKFQVLTAVQNLLTREAKIETFLTKK
jgi:hypothetical protein